MHAAKLPYTGTGMPPFQMGIQIFGDFKQLQPIDAAKVPTAFVWFCHPGEAREFMDYQMSKLSETMFGKTVGDRYEWDYRPATPDPVATLQDIRKLYQRG
jgi:hypothetical protein